MTKPASICPSRNGLIPRGAGERAIRDALCDFLAVEAPTHVILHELPVGGCRADVVAVGDDEILVFEIKSERDTLDRLNEQMRQFSSASHAAVVVAHEKHFDRKPYDNGNPRVAWNHLWVPHVWVWPRNKEAYLYAWELRRLRPQHRPAPPETWRMLELCWRDEIYTEAKGHGLTLPSRASKTVIMHAMVDNMTGRQITRAVCRQLRSRDARTPMQTSEEA